MSKKVLFILNILLLLACIAGLTLFLIQLVMAIRVGEIGRVLFYFVLVVICIELGYFSLSRLLRSRKSK